MELTLTPSQSELQSAARAYATELARGARERERAHTIHHDVIRGLGERGLLGVNIPEELGGAARGPVAYAAAVREIARGDAAVAVTMAVTNMVAEVITRFGTPEQRRRYVPRLVSGEFFGGAFGLSEPNAGSDAGALATRAERDGDHWVLNGQKMWITTGDTAGVIVVWARTGGPGPKGISCFLVEGGHAGLSAGKPEEKMGLRASHTVPLVLENVRLPDSARLAELGRGFGIAMAALDGGRIGIASQSLGMGVAALERARAHLAAHSSRFEEQLAALADMATELDAGWLLTLRAARLKETGAPFSVEAAMAKLFASEAANRAARACVRILGEAGALEEHEAARLVRDCRVTQIYEGTSEIQRVVVGRALLSH